MHASVSSEDVSLAGHLRLNWLHGLYHFQDLYIQVRHCAFGYQRIKLIQNWTS